MKATGWALDAPCRAYEAVGRVQRQLERLMRQPGVILGGERAESKVIKRLKQVSFRFKWDNFILRLH